MSDQMFEVDAEMEGQDEVGVISSLRYIFFLHYMKLKSIN